MKPKKPEAIHVDPLHARVIRGPRESDGRWYWRVERYDSGTTTSLGCRWLSADEVWRELAGRVSKGDVLKPEEVEARREIRTVDDLLRVWVATRVTDAPDLRPATIATYSAHAKQLRAQLGEVLLQAATRATWLDYRDRIQRTGRSSASVHLDLAVMAMAWRWARERGLPLAEWSKIDTKIVPRRELYTPRPHEVAEVVDRLDGWARDVVLFMHATGCRLGEAAGVRAEDIDARARLVRVSGKTGAREVPVVSPEVLDLLAVRSAATAGTGRPIWGVGRDTVRMQLRVMLTAAQDAAGVRRWTTHGFRRAAVDQLVRGGIEPATAAALLGHSVEIMLTKYRQVTTEDRVAAVKRAAMGSLPRGKVMRLPGTGSEG